MKARHCFQLFACVVLSLLPIHALGQQSDEKFTFVEGRYFEVVGTDHRSVSVINRLGEHVVELCASYLRAGSHDFPQRIFVALRPEDRVEFDGEYQIQIGARGQVSVDFRWDAELSFEVVCRALTEAYVVRYANFNYGPGASDRIPFWAVSALGSQCYIQLRPAQQGQYIKEAQADGLLKISSLLRLGWEDGREEGVSLRQGYWVLYALRQRGIARSDIGILLDRAVAGRDATAALETVVQPTDEDQQAITLDEWWQNQLVSYLSQDVEYCESLDVSRAWIEELVNFDAYRASGGELKDLRGLWQHRDSEALRTVLAARHEIIALRLERVNPAYYNSAQSLGALYETTLHAERRFEFIHALTAYLSDWEDTKRLHAKTHELLNASSSE